MYAYVGNDPVNLVDPTGKAACGGICIGLVALGSYLLVDGAMDAAEGFNDAADQANKTIDQNNSTMEDLVAGMKGDMPLSEVGKSLADQNQSQNDNVNSVAENGAKIAKGVPGSSMTGPGPTSKVDVAVGGVATTISNIGGSEQSSQNNTNDTSNTCATSGANKC